MKYNNIMYLLFTVFVLGGTVMKLFHIPYAMEVIGIGMVGGILYQSWHISKLKKKIQELESKR